jgi:hypothetical protein
MTWPRRDLQRTGRRRYRDIIRAGLRYSARSGFCTPRVSRCPRSQRSATSVHRTRLCHGSGVRSDGRESRHRLVPVGERVRPRHRLGTRGARQLRELGGARSAGAAPRRRLAARPPPTGRPSLHGDRVPRRPRRGVALLANQAIGPAVARTRPCHALTHVEVLLHCASDSSFPSDQRDDRRRLRRRTAPPQPQNRLGRAATCAAARLRPSLRRRPLPSDVAGGLAIGAAIGALVVLTLRPATAAVALRLARTPLRPLITSRS